MPYAPRVPLTLLRQFKSAGQGISGRQAGIRIIEAILAHFRAEITVLDKDGDGELFRVGSGNPRHGIHGIHIHPVSIHSLTFQLQAHKDAIDLLSDADFNMYVGLLLQALELGRYRAGFKKTP